LQSALERPIGDRDVDCSSHVCEACDECCVACATDDRPEQQRMNRGHA
jgi:hypothetical protein